MYIEKVGNVVWMTGDVGGDVKGIVWKGRVCSILGRPSHAASHTQTLTCTHAYILKQFHIFTLSRNIHTVTHALQSVSQSQSYLYIYSLTCTLAFSLLPHNSVTASCTHTPTSSHPYLHSYTSSPQSPLHIPVLTLHRQILIILTHSY